MFSIISALEYLHVKQNIVHGDISYDNIYIDSGTLYLGEIREFKEKVYQPLGISINAVNPFFQAPELKSQTTQPTRESDIFALGVFFYYLAYSESPFGLSYGVVDDEQGMK